MAGSNTGFLAGLISPSLDIEQRLDFSRTANSNVQTTNTSTDNRSIMLNLNSPNSTLSKKDSLTSESTPSQSGGVTRDSTPVSSSSGSSSFDFQTLAILGILGATAYFIFGSNKK